MIPKPGKVHAIAIMTLVDGFLSLAWGVGLIVGSITSLIGILCLPIAIYPFVLGIVEVIFGLKLLADPVNVDKAPTFVAIMQVADIALGDVIGLAVGVTSLILYNDPEVKAYFAQIGGTASTERAR